MFLDTSKYEQIKSALDFGLIRGITTNPSILLANEKPRTQQLKDLDDLGLEIIFVQLVGDDEEEMMDDYRSLVKLSKEMKTEIGMKVPVFDQGLKVIKNIRNEEPERKILATAIYTSDQGILASIAGADMLAPYYNRMENNATDPILEISKMRVFIDEWKLNTKILAASFKNASQVVNALTSGSHTVTIGYDVLMQMVNKDVALKAIKKFNQDGRKLG